MTTVSTIDRVRELLADEPSLRERRMFGGVSFMVAEKMVLSVRGDGALLVRVDPQQSAELVERHGAVRAEMGVGRDMGPGWLSVPAVNVTTNVAVEFWLRTALEYHVTLRSAP